MPDIEKQSQLKRREDIDEEEKFLSKFKKKTFSYKFI